MKRIFVVSLAALPLSVGSATAQMTVILGGSVEWEAGYFDLQGVPDERRHDFRMDTEIHIRADGEVDNGLLYGAAVKVEANQDTANNADEAYVYVGGNWGRIKLGDANGAASDFYVFAPTVGNEQIDGSWEDFLSAAEPVGNWYNPDDTGDSTKITYLTPIVMGFQAGVSYIPSVDDKGQAIDATKGDNAEDAFELGAQWGSGFADFDVVVGATYYTADTAVDAIRSAWSAGAQVGYEGFTVGGGYFSEDIEGDDETGWNVGLSYINGPIAVAGQYGRADYTVDGVGNELTVWGVGVAYTIAPGLVTAVDYVSADNEIIRESIIVGSMALSF